MDLTRGARVLMFSSWKGSSKMPLPVTSQYLQLAWLRCRDTRVDHMAEHIMVNVTRVLRNPLPMESLWI